MTHHAYLQKIAARLHRLRHGAVDRESIDPAREWVTGIILTVVCVCVGGAVSYQLYERTISLEISGDAVVAASNPYQASRTAAALDIFTARTAAYELIAGPVSTPVLDAAPALSPVGTAGEESVDEVTITDLLDVSAATSTTSSTGPVDSDLPPAVTTNPSPDTVGEAALVF